MHFWAKYDHSTDLRIVLGADSLKIGLF